MNTNANTVSLSQDVIVGLLKELPDDVLQDIFWKVFTDFETYALSEDEKSDLNAADLDFKKSETISWEDLQ